MSVKSAKTRWQEEAACHLGDADKLFADSTKQKRAKKICAGCPVQTECLVEALDNRVDFGVWGGTTERERRALLRGRPDVSSWRLALEDADPDHEQPQAS